MRFIEDILMVHSVKDKTIIDNVNGCGPKFERFFSKNTAINMFYNEILTDHTKEFEPACNAHDICYDCKVKQNECDKSIFENMKKICQNKYPIDNDFVNKLPIDKEIFSSEHMEYLSGIDYPLFILEILKVSGVLDYITLLFPEVAIVSKGADLTKKGIKLTAVTLKLFIERLEDKYKEDILKEAVTNAFDLIKDNLENNIEDY